MKKAAYLLLTALVCVSSHALALPSAEEVRTRLQQPKKALREIPATLAEKELLVRVAALSVDEKWEEAIGLLERASGPGTSAKIDYALAQVHQGADQRERAIASYRVAIRKEPSFAHARLGLVSALASVKDADPEETVENWLAVYDAGLAGSLPLVRSGMAYLDMKAFAGAEVLLRAAVEENPGDIRARVLLAQALDGLGRSDEADSLTSGSD